MKHVIPERSLRAEQANPTVWIFFLDFQTGLAIGIDPIRGKLPVHKINQGGVPGR
jgi:hypothetical protein